MGPIALFDKSFLQSLNVDESVWFDHFFYPIVCPLFYVETLADLEKAVRAGRKPEQEVGFIAQKTPEMHGGPCIHHSTLCLANLMGNSIPMNGRIPVAGGRPVKVEGEVGVIFDLSPEAQAFSRWQNGEFLEVERQFAQSWRASLASLDLAAVASGMRACGIEPKTCKSLEDAKRLTDAIVSSTDNQSDQMMLAFLFLEIPGQYQRPILEKWTAAGCPPLSTYAPYAAYVLKVEVFFQIALAASHISIERPSNRLDIAYLFYLPFSMVFVSSDKLHRRCTPLFLRPDQEFVWGEDLKADLKRLNEHYLQLPDEKKEKGIMRFASYPPETGNFLVSGVWDRHMRSWRGKSSVERPPPDLTNDKMTIDRLTRFTKAPTAQPEQIDFAPDDADVMSIQRRVHKRKGSWYQVPKNLKVTEEK
jgi:hypothetical protein